MKAKLKIFCSILTVAIFLYFSVAVINFAFNYGSNNAFGYYYISNGVEAKVYANYYIGNESHKMMSGENDYVVFSGEEDDVQKSLSPQEEQIDLSSSDGFVVFEYEFINNSDTKNFSVNVFETPSIVNMNVFYAYSYTKLDDFSGIDSYVFEMAPVLAGKDNSIFVYVKVAVANLANDASYSGTFSFRFYTCDVYEVTLVSEHEVVDSFYAIYGEDVASVEIPEIEGKEFVGYFTEENGRGNQIVDEDGMFIDIWDIESNTTLYAYYI